MADFDWTKDWCDKGTITESGRKCCSDAQCSKVGADNTRECESYWDVDCRVPRTGDGGACSDDAECLHGACKNGRLVVIRIDITNNRISFCCSLVVPLTLSPSLRRVSCDSI